MLPGGLAIMLARFSTSSTSSTWRSPKAALRHGVLYDLLGRVQHHDMREATVAQFMRRYHVDAAQAERVRELALQHLRSSSRARRRSEDDPDRLLLDWAARLAEIGLSIAHAQYHKHSAYILSNADMPGFSRMEQQRLARIVLAHRGKLEQDAGRGPRGRRLDAGVRAAHRVALLRSRTDVRLPRCARRGRRVALLARPAADPGWRGTR